MKTYKIGRDPKADIILTSAICSREHAILKIADNGAISLQDISSNGTTVNGMQIHKTTVFIQQGDVILFGGVEKLNWDLIDIDKIEKQKPSEIQSPQASAEIKNKPLESTSIENPGTTNKEKVKYIKEVSPKKPKRRKNFIYFFGCVAIIAISLFFYKTYLQKPKIVAPTEIYNKYKNAVALVQVEYFIRIHTTLDDVYMGLNDSNEIDLKSKKEDLKPFSSEGTSFYIDSNGILITNRHVVEPWNNDESLHDYFNQVIKPFIKKIFKQAGYMNENPTFVGEMKGVYIYPNGTPFQLYNRIECRVNKVSEKPEIDLASLQIISHTLPYEAVVITPSDIEMDEKRLEVNTNAYIIGFPLGDGLAMDEDDRINCSSTQGSITQAPSISYIQYSATSDHGASGSPVFNQYGKLIAVNYLQFGKQSFNRGILAKYIEDVK